MNEPFTAAERCAERLAGQSRDLTVGEQVIKVPLTRDLTIPLNRTLNPFKLADLQYVLNFRTFYGLLPDVDLKEIYFEGAWEYQKDAFVLANWRAMSVKGMKENVREAHPEFGGRRVYPPGKVDVDTLNTKEEIVRAFWELTYVPEGVYMTAVAGAHVLRSVKAGDVGEDPDVVKRYLEWACRAGLDLPVIRGLAEKCRLRYVGFRERDIDVAAERATAGGHADVLDLLVSEFGARINDLCSHEAARWGHDAMIDHLVEKYQEDPNDEICSAAIHEAASRGRVRTVKHLVEKHNVDIHQDDGCRETALDLAERHGRTECAAYLRALTFTQLLAGEYPGDINVTLIFFSAAKRGDDAMIDLLVERYGVDPNGADEDGWTALHMATWYDRVRTVKHLVEKHKVDIHQRGDDGFNALDWAEHSRMTECADYLRALTYTQLLAGEYRGDVDVELLYSAARRGHDAMIDLLVERYGVDPNGADDEDGWTALHWATEYDRVRTVKHLVEKHNVDIHKRTRDGETALDWAEEHGRTECAAVLRGYR